MKKTLATTTLLGLAILTGCSASPAVQEDPSSAPAESTATPASTSDAGSAPVAAGSVKDACESFNALWAQYAAVPGGDSDAYEEIYLASEEAKGSAPEQVSGLFAALSLIAIDHSGAAETGGEPEQASKDAVRDAVFANSGACTAEGVTLTL